MRLRFAAAVVAALAVPSLAAMSPAYAAAPNHPHHPMAKIRPVPGIVTLNDSGNGSFALQGMHLPPSTSYYTDSPGLNAACSYDELAGETFTADITGRFWGDVSVDGCVPGHYQIIATQVEAPNKQYSSWVTLKAPKTLGQMARFYTSPSVVTEGTDGSVAFTVFGVHLPAGTTWEEESPGLDTACSSNEVSGTTVTADFNGNTNNDVDAYYCNPGTYSIVVSQQEAPFKVYNTSITIRPPSALVAHGHV